MLDISVTPYDDNNNAVVINGIIVMTFPSYDYARMMNFISAMENVNRNLTR